MKSRLRELLSPVPGMLGLARLTAETVRVCMRWRVTGLAAEAGFFALLSLPPLIFGLLGAVGYLAGWLGEDIRQQVTNNVVNYADQFLTPDVISNVITPTLNQALSGGRADVVSIGFLLSLWSGSRCLNVLLDTISIMYGQGGVRGIIRTRVMSLSLYFVSLLFAAVLVPLMVIGPDLLTRIMPERLRFLMIFYWPLVGGLTIIGFATLFFIATPKRAPWVRDLPGAALTLVIWVLSSYGLRWFLGNSVDGFTVYGPLSATIVILIWLYFLSIGVLIGAALNAAAARLWPPPEMAPLHEKAREWLGDGVARIRPDEERGRRGRPDENEDEDSGLDSSRAIG
ncbi:YihY/virulence factor BrkB family protein [Luteipulveratus sp. YIM 133132]|uniref:YihY/virulence factor BrkB family protein n=1 Tax=Luteipulveratus flavus TaxID=3031728 RepID=A0ABT6C9M3_9MICO|nr:MULTISPECIES: YihY/virulence factor BrkB family protein [unclassified Luteipulveratus]MDE9364457.1 YihY/virulence factor BrkB family protein [Luteipulveratus sp. YIM 133132]MDF8263996.1 YihY/virulence factor BrkB family protein [Luteipulveratus sp. YIM 133296]